MNNKIYADSVKFQVKKDKITVIEHHQDLSLIGTGRSALAFKIKNTNKVIKVFPESFSHIAKKEAAIYKKLKHIEYFPAIYETGVNYIVMDYIKGHTLFSCLNRGIPISEKHIKEVDNIIELVRKAGLNPSDIHLKNILITPDNQIKMIDVARFSQEKQCTQWDDLKTAYQLFYKNKVFPKKLPEFLLNAIAALYKRKLLRVKTKNQVIMTERK